MKHQERVALRVAFWGSAIACGLHLSHVLIACTVTPQQHAANTAESVQYAAELAQCREDAKKDGGWVAYQGCACKADAKHSFDAGVGCP